jgi:hypothetical protein
MGVPSVEIFGAGGEGEEGELENQPMVCGVRLVGDEVIR